MFDRRTFLGASLGVGLGMGSRSIGVTHAASGESHQGEPRSPAWDRDEYERVLTSLPENRLAPLGRPRSWSLVKQGFVPFAPEARGHLVAV